MIDLTNKSAKERAKLKGQEIAKVASKVCIGCDKTFANENPRLKPYTFNRKKYCCQSCYNANRSGSKNPNYRGAIKNAECEKCGKLFLYLPSAQRGRFCSFDCVKKTLFISGKSNISYKGSKQTTNCCVCDKEISFYRVKGKADTRFCSKKCLGVSMTGEKHRKWKGGKINKQYHHRRRKAMIRGAEGSHTQEEWEQLKKRYDYMCLCCKRCEPEIMLTLDHVIPITKGGTDDIGNIQPLCLSCNCKKYTCIRDYRPSVYATV